MSSSYINNFCFEAEISEFLHLDKQTWLKAMIENYCCVTPYDLADEQIEACLESFKGVNLYGTAFPAP